MSDVEVVAAADPSAAARRRATERYGLVCFADVEELLDATTLDLLCVLSPVRTHREVVELAVEKRVPILCEKPLAATVEDATALVESCASAGVPLAYGSSYRFLGAVQTARDAISSGAIGEVRLVVETLFGGSGRDQQQPIGAEHYPLGEPGGSAMGLVDHGIHFIDVAPWLAGRAVVRTWGRGNLSGAPLEPEFIVLELEGGALASLTCFDGSWSTSLPNEGHWLRGAGWDVAGRYLEPGSWGRDLVELHVYGTTGALRIVPYGHRLYLSGPDGLSELAVDGAAPPQHFALQLRAVLSAVEEGDAPPVPGEIGLTTLRLLHSIYSNSPSNRSWSNGDPGGNSLERENSSPLNSGGTHVA
jgi:predicted dehydrogenase